MFSPKNVRGIIGTMLALIALYLILQNATGATSMIATIFRGGGSLAQTLQGR